jgi:hypothetical protein
MDFVFGAAVVGNDGAEAGTLDRVLVDPRTREISHLVVRSPRVSEDVLLPLSLVQGNADHRLLLHVAAGDLEHMPRYYEGRTSSPPAGRVDTSVVPEPADRRQDLERALNVSPDARQYGPETRVTTADNAEGRLVSLAAEQYTNRVSQLCVGGLGDQDITVPDRWIGELGTDVIAVSATREQLRHLVGSQAGPYVARSAGEARGAEGPAGQPG